MPPTLPTGERAAVAPAHAELIVRVRLGRPDLAGDLLIDGRLATAFTGWTGLLTALDQALDALQPPGPQTPPSEHATALTPLAGTVDHGHMRTWT